MVDTKETLVLERYRLLDLIAVGGTARVFRARDEQLGRDVAVKLLHPHLLPDDTSRRRLAAEARAAAGLSHPGIVTVYDVDTDPEAPAIVMELVDGGPLSDRLSQGPMPPREVARLGAEVADALFHAHRRGIVHRDVKPGNILVERGTGRARLVDFGIAHSLAAGAESLTQTGTALGTPRYMAPEQMAGGRVGPRTDLWSLGVVLYQALTGRVPFDGPTPLAIARQQQEGASPLDGTDAVLGAIVLGCLADDIGDRPLDASALAASLRSWLAGDVETDTSAITAPMPAALPALAAGDGEQQAAATASAPAASPGPGEHRRRAGLVVPAALATLVLAGFVLAALALPNLTANVPSPSEAPRRTPSATPTDAGIAWLAALEDEYREACGEPIPPDKLEGENREEIEKKVTEEIEKCLEEEDRENDDEGGGGPPPKDDGRGNGGGRGNRGGGGGGD